MGEIIQSVRLQGMSGIMRIDALLDSGATTSYIRESVAKRIGLINLGNIKFEVADGREVPGYISSVLVLVQNRSAETEVIVTANLQEQLILGQNFLQENDIILNFKGDKFKFGEGQPKTRRIHRL